MLNRKTLLARLSDVDAALAPAACPIPIQAHYWFTGRHLMTFNGKIALMTPLKTDFSGGVPRKIVALLKSSGAEEVDITAKDDVLTIKAGGSKSKLPLLPEHDFNFQMPDRGTADAIGIDPGRFLQTMEACLRSCANITHTIDLLGITLIEKMNSLLLFATDVETITHGEVDLKDKLGMKAKRVILPMELCKAFVKVAAGAEALYMDITDDYLMVDHNGVTLYGTTIEPDARPLPFTDLIYDIFTRKVEDDMVRVVPEIVPALERAAIITTKAKENARTTVEVTGGQITIYATSENGEAQEAIGFPKHPNVVTLVNAERMLEGCLNYEKMVITSDAVIFTRDRLVFMVSGGMQ